MTSVRIDQESNGSEVEFRFYRKDAVKAWVAGDFTRWEEGRLAMDRCDDGWWALKVAMPAGDFRFRYLADEAGTETWFTDFASHGVEYAEGQWNSVVVVPEGSRATAAPKQRREVLTDHPEKLAA